jgi:uncharacterized membrane protein YphA (DoxX/SURF4 family)
MNFLSKLSLIIKPYGSLLLRLGLGFIFLWSGLSKLGVSSNPLGICTNSAEAIDFLSSLTWLPFDPAIFVFWQSIAELALGIILIIGLWVEAAAALSVLLFLSFFFIFDFSLIWKNVGLLVMALVVWGEGAGKWSVDDWFKNRKFRQAQELNIKP